MNKKISLIFVVAVIVAVIWYLESGKVRPGALQTESEKISFDESGVSGEEENPPVAGENTKDKLTLAALVSRDKNAGYSSAVEIAGPTGFINTSSDFKLKSLIGKKIILLDFWTYSCINCIRTFPYLNEWYEKYREAGLEIVGVHTPEFAFEKNYANVKMAVEKYGIKYPVVMDNDYATWQAYENRYWPHHYLIDLAGYIVHDQIGEGNYEATEKEIQKLLRERTEILEESSVNISDSTVSFPAKVGPGGFMSPETYFGSARNEHFGSGSPGKNGVQSFNEPATINLNILYLIGTWNITPEYAGTPATVGSAGVGSDRIIFRYQAKGVYLVVGSSVGNIDVEVLRNGKSLEKSFAGEDIIFKDSRSFVRVNEKRLYRLIDDTAPGEHLLELIIPSPGLEAYAFTFG